MEEYLLLGLASVIVFGVGAQWISWRFKLPSIILLLIFGFIAGPITGLVQPDILLGEFLFPIVSVSVALILFEGGLTLQISELKKIGGTVFSLVSFGVIISFAVISFFAYTVLELSGELSILLGAVLVVTGPTVILPMLRTIQPSPVLNSILKWEGIVIDPVGAMLAVLVFEGILIKGTDGATIVAVQGMANILVIGVGIGMLAALLLVVLIKNYLVPDYLQNPVTLMLVVLTFTVSNMLQHEAGLMAVTIMGITLANQKSVTVKHIIAFKENLRILLISSLFIVLSARLDVEIIKAIDKRAVVFLLLLIFVARPLSVYFSTFAAGLRMKERVFLMFMAPRGIVAAAIASIFSLKLAESTNPELAAGADIIVPYTFIVIIGTVFFYGIFSLPIAKALNVARPNPQGVLMVGAHPWSRQIASALMEEGIQVLMTDINRNMVSKGRLAGIPVYYGSVLTENTPGEIELNGIGKLLALTPNDNVNALAVLHYSEIFDRKDVYQLTPHEIREGDELAPHLKGRFLFAENVNFDVLSDKFREGYLVKRTNITKEYGLENHMEANNNDVVPLFIITESKELKVCLSEKEVKVKAGETLISVVPQKTA